MSKLQIFFVLVMHCLLVGNKIKPKIFSKLETASITKFPIINVIKYIYRL